MASPQLEDGALQVALELQSAIMRFEFSALERRILDAIMRYTYAAGKTRADITAEDIRLMIEGSKRVRTDRIEQAVNKLVHQNVLSISPKQLGLQKDYTRWLEGKVDKMSSTLKGINNYIYITNSRRVVDKMSTSPSNPPSTVENLLAYSQETSGFVHGITAWRIERMWANKLYRKYLTITNDPKLAWNLVQDYIDENEWMRQNVQRQFAYMYSRFDQWYKQIPRKPREIRENEEATGRRNRYNVTKKRWEEANAAKSSGLS